MIKFYIADIEKCLNLEKSKNKDYYFKILNKKADDFITSASINSNEIFCKHSTLFIAIKGKKFDATDFLLQAKKSGANSFIIDKKNWENKNRCFKKKIIENLQNIIITNNVEKTFQVVAEKFLDLGKKIVEQEKNEILKKI
ncbi:MAG: hypothetical protein LBF97_04820, partial [Elusimicrobiota bacterium]|nr:hypothetical protein [Elusimicrobiota bacterium]